MSRPLHILVDLDGVVADWGKAYDEALDRHMGRASHIPRTKDQPVWDLRAARSDSEIAIIDEIMTAPYFYENLPLIKGAQAGIPFLVNQGHKVTFVSSPYLDNPTCASDKLDWVRRHFGRQMATETILTGDKTSVRGDILIDDRPTINGRFEPEWRHVVFGDYRYNQSSQAPARLGSWEISELIGLLAEEVCA